MVNYSKLQRILKYVLSFFVLFFVTNADSVGEQGAI